MGKVLAPLFVILGLVRGCAFSTCLLIGGGKMCPGVGGGVEGEGVGRGWETEARRRLS